MLSSRQFLHLLISCKKCLLTLDIVCHSLLHLLEHAILVRIGSQVKEVTQQQKLVFEAEHLFDACSAHIELFLFLNAVHHVLDQLPSRYLLALVGQGLLALCVLLLLVDDLDWALFAFFLLGFFSFLFLFLLLFGLFALLLLFFLFELILHFVNARHLILFLRIHGLFLSNFLLYGGHIEVARLRLVDQSLEFAHGVV